MFGEYPQKEKQKKNWQLQGVEALADFIKEIGLPTTLRELGMKDKSMLEEIANSCNLSLGSYKKMTHEEILEILNECFKKIRGEEFMRKISFILSERRTWNLF